MSSLPEVRLYPTPTTFSHVVECDNNIVMLALDVVDTLNMCRTSDQEALERVANDIIKFSYSAQEIVEEGDMIVINKQLDERVVRKLYAYLCTVKNVRGTICL